MTNTTQEARNQNIKGTAGLDFKFGRQNLSVSAGVSNVLNTVYYDHLSRYKNEGINKAGRSFTLGLSVPLEIAKL